MNELWKEIPGYEGYYAVSNYGRVKSLERVVPAPPPRNWFTIRGRIMSLGKGRYLKVHLQVNGVGQHCNVHRLVAEAFVPNPDGLPEVNHKDCNKHNNLSDNLEWVTRKGNAQHAAANGLLPLGELSGVSKFSDVEVLQIRKRLAVGESCLSIAKDFGVTDPTIGFIKRGITWRHLLTKK